MTERKLLVPVNEKAIERNADGSLKRKSKVTFPLYRNYMVVGEEMKNDILKCAPGINSSKDRFVFNLSGSEREGTLGLSYGVFLMATLLDRYDLNDGFSDEEKKKLKGSFEMLLADVNQHGFNVSPFSTKEINESFFGISESKYSFIESLTWVLSCFLYGRRLHRTKRIDFTDMMPSMTEWVARALCILVNNVIRQNGELGYEENATDYAGWGSLTKCTEPSLYFTHSVCETFGDVEDTVLGNDEVVGLEKDDEFKKMIEDAYLRLPNRNKKIKSIVDEFKKICLCVGANVYKKYEKSLGKRFFYADGSEIASVDQISYSMQSPVLLNHLYVVLSAVYVNYHKEVEKNDKTVGKEVYASFCSTLKNAVEMVYDTYEELRRKGKETIVNREFATFTEKHPEIEMCRKLSNERIPVAVLEALIIKAKAMIITYVTQYPERELGEILNVLEGNRNSEGWIWNAFGYDLQQTERGISAIREFYDYYESYQKEFAEKERPEIESLQNQYLDRIKVLEKQLDDVKQQCQKDVEDLRIQTEQEKQREIEEEREKHTLEKELLKIVTEQVRTATIGTMVEVFNAIAEDNKVAKDTLNNEQKMFKKAMLDMASSIFVYYNLAVNNADNNPSWSEDNKKIEKVMKSDFAAFLVSWLNKVLLTNNMRDDRQSNYVLKDIIDGKKEN